MPERRVALIDRHGGVLVGDEVAHLVFDVLTQLVVGVALRELGEHVQLGGDATRKAPPLSEADVLPARQKTHREGDQRYPLLHKSEG